MGWERLAIGLGVVALCQLAGGAVIYVDDDAKRGINDGTSWADAFVDLQDALAIAQVDDEIRIAQGVYKPGPPDASREVTFNLVDGVIVQGGYAGLGAIDPDALHPQLYETVLSGDLDGDDGLNFQNYGDNSYHVLTARELTTATALRGVTIRSGSADFPLSGGIPDPRSSGGGIHCDSVSAMTLVDCIIRDNRGSFSGGGVHAPSTSSEIVRCKFISNRMISWETIGGGLTIGGGTVSDTRFEGNSSGHGGAVSGSATFRRCIFQGNGAAEVGGAITSKSTIAIDCDFVGNGSQHWGGAFSGYNSTFINCRFLRNASGMGGGAMRVGDNTRAINCLFSGNLAQPGSAVSSCFPGAGCNFSYELTNCTIIGNGHPFNQPSAIVAGDNSIVQSCVLWDNGGEDQASQLSTASISINNCIVQGWTGALGGINNHGNDPRFIDADGPDDIYGTADDNPRLMPNSPCIDAGDSFFLPPDTFDLDDDGDVTEQLPLDLDLLPRVVGANVDMGAFEFQGVPCRADIDGSGAVGVADLLAVISSWGPCPAGGQPCNADLDLSMSVGVSDLLAVITTWGPCP